MYATCSSSRLASGVESKLPNQAGRYSEFRAKHFPAHPQPPHVLRLRLSTTTPNSGISHEAKTTLQPEGQNMLSCAASTAHTFIQRTSPHRQRETWEDSFRQHRPVAVWWPHAVRSSSTNKASQLDHQSLATAAKRAHTPSKQLIMVQQDAIHRDRVWHVAAALQPGTLVPPRCPRHVWRVLLPSAHIVATVHCHYV